MDDENAARTAAWADWTNSIDRDDIEGDPKELIQSAASAMWNAGRDYARFAEAPAGAPGDVREAAERLIWVEEAFEDSQHGKMYRNDLLLVARWVIENSRATR